MPTPQVLQEPRPLTVPSSSRPVAKASSPESADPPAEAARAAALGSRPSSSAPSRRRSRSRSPACLQQLARVIDMLASPSTHPFDTVAARKASITARKLPSLLNGIADEVDDINRRNGIVPRTTAMGSVLGAAGAVETPSSQDIRQPRPLADSGSGRVPTPYTATCSERVTSQCGSQAFLLDTCSGTSVAPYRHLPMPGFRRAPIDLVPAPGLPIRVAADDDTGFCVYGCEHLGICAPCLRVVGIATSQCRHGLCQKRCMMSANHDATAWHYCRAHRPSAVDSTASSAESSSSTGSANVKSAPVKPEDDVKTEDKAAGAERPGAVKETQADVPEEAGFTSGVKENTLKTARPSKRKRVENWNAGLTGAGKPRHQ